MYYDYIAAYKMYHVNLYNKHYLTVMDQKFDSNYANKIFK